LVAERSTRIAATTVGVTCSLVSVATTFCTPPLLASMRSAFSRFTHVGPPAAAT